MNLYSIETGYFKLDGGAMFGVVPKVIWSRYLQPDEKNLCTWAMRCLLVETSDRLVLIDTGLGNKQSEKFFSYYEPHGNSSLLQSIKDHGFSPGDITDVLLTHLHFDHCGGAVSKREDGTLYPTFKNATYWSQQDHWNWAVHPNDREKASFLTENFLPLQESGQLQFIGNDMKLFDGFELIRVDGHTEAQMLPKLRYQDRTLVYMADLMPSVVHMPIAWVMGYDVRPLQTLKEKAAFLEQAAKEDYVLFFEHDATNECCTLSQTEKGVRADELFKLADWREK